MGASIFGPIALIAGFALIVLGSLLLKIGFWPRRRGDEPHCRACGYELTGVDSGVCPECGRTWTQSTVTRGIRCRRRGIGTLGMAIFILPLLLALIHGLSGFDVYRIWPEKWLFNQLESGKDRAAQLALDELVRRHGTAGLSEAGETRLTDLAIREQTRTPQRSFSAPLGQYLVSRFQKKQVTDAQAIRLFEPAIQSCLRVRPIVAVGDSIPIEILRPPGPMRGFAASLELRRLTVGDRQIDEWNNGPMGMREPAIVEARGFPMPQGEWDVQARCEISILGLPRASLWSGYITLRSKVKVVATRPASLVELVGGPRNAQLIRQSIKIKDVRFNPVYRRFYLTTEIRQPPQNIAFNILARCGGQEQSVFSFALPKGGNLEQSLYFAANPNPGKLDLVFRAEPALARRTVDLFDIWKDDIVVENIPFQVTDERGR